MVISDMLHAKPANKVERISHMELEIVNLSKQFKKKSAVKDINVTLTPGIWGLLGANGAGKTTILCQNSNPSADLCIYDSDCIYHFRRDTRRNRLWYRNGFCGYRTGGWSVVLAD